MISYLCYLSPILLVAGADAEGELAQLTVQCYVVVLHRKKGKCPPLKQMIPLLLSSVIHTQHYTLVDTIEVL
jgi:hypothetical protein